MEDKYLLIFLGIGIVLGLGALIYFNWDELNINLIGTTNSKLRGITKQVQVNTYFEDCADITDWVISPLLSWSSTVTQCQHNFPALYGNMTSANFSLLNYKDANLSFIYSHNNFTANTGVFRIYLLNGSAITNIFEKNSTNINSVTATNASINISLNSISFSNNMSLTAQCEGTAGSRASCAWDNINITGDDGICTSSNNGLDPATETIKCDGNCRYNGYAGAGSDTVIISNSSGGGIVTVNGNITGYTQININVLCGLNGTIGFRI